MRKLRFSVFLTALLSLLAFSVPASAATSGIHPAFQQGSVCKKVTSSQDWGATICAIVDFNDLSMDSEADALITFRVNSGSIAWTAGTGMFSTVCPNCHTEDYIDGPGSSTYDFHLSNHWYSPEGGDETIQAVINTPCVAWTNGQIACYHGDLRSDPEYWP